MASSAAPCGAFPQPFAPMLIARRCWLVPTGKGRYGYAIRWEDYEDGESSFGWFLELIDPEAREFPPGLRPVSYRSRRLDGDD